MSNAPIVEIFETIQGEGKNIGVPSIFVRFWGCNLRCRFAGVECDTPYAVTKERERALMMPPEQIAAKIIGLRPKHIVWTGGEPMLYQKYIVAVMNMIPSYSCEVETNGTVPCDPETADVIDQFNMSVKLKSSNQEPAFEHKRINKDAIKTYPSDKAYFKFVWNGNDLEEIKDLAKQFPQFDIMVMPEGFRRRDVIDHSAELIEICIDNGWRFSPREHIIIWDYQRGV